MFQKLANAVADQVVYKLAALNQSYSQNDTLAALRMEKKAHLQAAIKLAQLEKLAAGELSDPNLLAHFAEEYSDYNPADLIANLNKVKQEGNVNPFGSPDIAKKQLERKINKGVSSNASAADKNIIKNQKFNEQITGLKNELAGSNRLNKILGGTAAGLGGLGALGGIGLGIANARKAKQIAKLKQLGLLGGGAAALGGLGLGYLMGDN